MPQRSVFCIALSRGRAGRIVLNLKEASFSNFEISALFLDQNAIVTRAVADANMGAASEAPAVSADVICGVMAWIAAVACHVVPGVDPVIAAGSMATVLSNSPTSGVAYGLIELGVPEVDALRYERKIKDGHILVSVHAESSSKSDRASEIFAAAGAEDICAIVEDRSAKTLAVDGQESSRPCAV